MKYKEINIKFIPHKEMRYSTSGDYVFQNGRWNFFIADQKNEYYNFLILIHELTEMILTQQHGIKEEDITKFDIESGLEDPGASKKAPYYKEHLAATKIEKMLCKMLKLDWDKYNNSL